MKRNVPAKQKAAWFRCRTRGCDCKIIKCETLEKGIYTVEMFTKRNTALAKEIRQQLIPTTQHILDSYPILTIEEKNQLWKLVLKRATVYRSLDDELSIHIHPNLPGA